MADFNFRQQFPYFRGDGSFRTQGASYRPNGYHHHQRFQNFNWGIPPRGYFNPRFRYDTPRMIGLRDRSFQSSRPTYFNSRYTQCQWYSGLETTGSKGYNQNKGNFAGKQDNKAFGTYLDKLRAAVDRREDEAAEYLLNNFISTTLIKSVKELNRENGKIGKHADRVKYKKPKKFNKNDQIKAYAIDYKLEFIITSEPEIGFVRERGGEGCFVEMGPIVEEDLQKISKYLLETEFERVSFTGLDEEMMKFYVLMNSVDFLVIPSKNLVYERNKIAGGLFTKSKRTMEDIDDLYLEECPVIFLEGYRETAETTEDGTLIRQCRLIILDDKRDEVHFYKDLRKRQEKLNAKLNENLFGELMGKQVDEIELKQGQCDTGLNETLRNDELNEKYDNNETQSNNELNERHIDNETQRYDEINERYDNNETQRYDEINERHDNNETERSDEINERHDNNKTQRYNEPKESNDNNLTQYNDELNESHDNNETQRYGELKERHDNNETERSDVLKDTHDTNETQRYDEIKERHDNNETERSDELKERHYNNNTQRNNELKESQDNYETERNEEPKESHDNNLAQCNDELKERHGNNKTQRNNKLKESQDNYETERNEEPKESHDNNLAQCNDELNERHDNNETHHNDELKEINDNNETQRNDELKDRHDNNETQRNDDLKERHDSNETERNDKLKERHINNETQSNDELRETHDNEEKRCYHELNKRHNNNKTQRNDEPKRAHDDNETQRNDELKERHDNNETEHSDELKDIRDNNETERNDELEERYDNNLTQRYDKLKETHDNNKTERNSELKESQNNSEQKEFNLYKILGISGEGLIYGFSASNKTVNDFTSHKESNIITVDNDCVEMSKVELNKKKSVGFLERARRSLSRMLWKN